MRVANECRKLCALFPAMFAFENQPASRRCTCLVETRWPFATNTGPSFRPATNARSFLPTSFGNTAVVGRLFFVERSINSPFAKSMSAMSSANAEPIRTPVCKSSMTSTRSRWASTPLAASSTASSRFCSSSRSAFGGGGAHLARRSSRAGFAATSPAS
jgi:hypothetical protein